MQLKDKRLEEDYIETTTILAYFNFFHVVSVVYLITVGLKNRLYLLYFCNNMQNLYFCCVKIMYPFSTHMDLYTLNLHFRIKYSLCSTNRLCRCWSYMMLLLLRYICILIVSFSFIAVTVLVSEWSAVFSITYRILSVTKCNLYSLFHVVSQTPKHIITAKNKNRLIGSILSTD